MPSLTLSYREFATRCRLLASALSREGITRGDVVSILAPNTPPHLEAHFGVPMAGAILNSINTRLDASTIAYVLDHGASMLLLVDDELLGLAREAVARLTPSEILVLTFSNKAAEELRERIARSAPAAAAQIWAGTFHAFGLELLRQYGHLIGLPADPKLTDTNAALGVLEDLLPTLPLDHYLVLHEPTQGLVDILKAISRAKDELVDPAGYRALGEAMPTADGRRRDGLLAAWPAGDAGQFAPLRPVAWSCGRPCRS